MIYSSCNESFLRKLFISDLGCQVRYHEIERGWCPSSSSAGDIPVVECGVRWYLNRNLDTRVDKAFLSVCSLYI